VKIFSDIENYGTLTVSGGTKLLAGMQESGNLGIFSYASAHSSCAYYHKFMNTMSNTPSSITLVEDFSYNVSSVRATLISSEGFLLEVYTANGGTTRWRGTYTTVGN
jgi:hypothetical protein